MKKTVKNRVAFFLYLCPLFAYTQSVLKGIVYDSNSNPISGAIVQLLEDEKHIKVSDFEGVFLFTSLKKANYTLLVSAIGFEDKTQKVTIGTKNSSIQIILKRGANKLTEVIIEGKTITEKKRETGYAIDILETKAIKNSIVDLNQLIKSTSGVNIRESGGLGSDFNLSLNGLSGNQVRYFIDGIPMENFGSALSLNNYPINLVEKIEIYKGVVPISLGADALGGAINLISGLKQKKYLDVSYSLGSFNTHRFALNTQHTSPKKDFFVKITSFINHSDNNYLMKGVPVFDLKLGNKIGDIDRNRFHDQYTSAMLSTEVGVLDKKFADELFFKITTATNRNNYQHSDNNILRALGDFYTKNNTTLFSSFFEKKISKFNLKAYALYGNISEEINDSGRRKFNWTGDFIERGSSDNLGELGLPRSLFILTDQTFKSQFNLKYKLSKTQNIEFNYTYNHLRRKGEDRVNTLNTAFNVPNTINKNIVGLGYNFNSLNKKLGFDVFGKRYHFLGAIKFTEKPEIEAKFSALGYGAVVSYKPIKSLTLKSSYEKAFRLPEGYEILGDGLFTQPNFELEPEASNNFNIGYRLYTRLNKFNVQHEINLFYRESTNFIRFNALGLFGEYENLASVTSKGIETGITTRYNNRLELQFNLTYQNLTDQEEFDEGIPNTNFESKLPNIPYLFFNTRFGANFFQNKFSVFWNTRFVESFFLTWEELGNREGKNKIPSQLIHGLEVDYAFKKGKYNLSASINNLTDELVFDNFRIQKPGRAFYLKLRYFFSKNK